MDLPARLAVMRDALAAIPPSTSSTFAVFPSNRATGERFCQPVSEHAWEGECFQTIEVCACPFATPLGTSFYKFHADGKTATTNQWAGGGSIWRFYAPNGDERVCCLDGAMDLAAKAIDAVGIAVLGIVPCTPADYDVIYAAKARLSPFPVDDYVFRRCFFSLVPVLVDVRVQFAFGLGGADRNDVPPNYTIRRRQHDYQEEITCTERMHAHADLASARKRAAFAALGV